MKKIMILGSISLGLVLSSCNSSNRVVSNFYEDGIYYNPAIGRMTKGSLASNEQNQREEASAVEDYFDPNYKSQEQTVINNNFYPGGFNPMWGMGFQPMWGMGFYPMWGMGFNPMWMRPGLSFGIGWGMGWNHWGMGWRSSWMYNPWMWDPWMSSMMMWDPFWGHPMAWGNPWMNPWHPGFGWGPVWISNQPPRIVTPVRGIRSGSYASTGSGTGRKISTPTNDITNRTTQMRNYRDAMATESPRPTSRIAQQGVTSESSVSRLRSSDLRATREMTSSASAAPSQTISRGGNYAERLNANSLRADRIQSGSNQPSVSRPLTTPQSGQSARPTYSSPIQRGGQSSTPTTRQYSPGQMESIQNRPIQRQGTWNQSAPASRQSFPSSSGGSRQFNSSPSFNSGGGATRGGGGSTGGGRLR
ncbi:MAG: hypothetical protein ACK4KT_02975 [Thermaurantimonas sp.]